MVVATSDSCNTLVSLDDNRKEVTSSWEGVGTTSSLSCTTSPLPDYVSTDLFLPAEDDCFGCSNQAIFLPTQTRVDEYMKRIPAIVEAADELLANEPLLLDGSCQEQVLYVGQGEVAHATSSQCDVLVSDRATTCHILALHSSSSAASTSTDLFSMAHLDSTAYESCIRSMIREHIAHHNPPSSSSSFEEGKKEGTLCIPTLRIHILGGFEDPASIEISNWLVPCLARLAHEFQDSIQWILETCAISSLNDNGYRCPVGRGLGLNLHTGQVFLAQVATPEWMGPLPELRAIRCWMGPCSTLSLIHTSKKTGIEIQPFSYSVRPEMEQVLALSDEALLQLTSTSPLVEQEDYCAGVRASLQFMLETPSHEVFPSTHKSLRFHRKSKGSSSSFNTWVSATR